MPDFFLFIGLPYIALFSFVVVSIYRFRSRRFSYSALSSQFLEKEKMFWGSTGWHIGIGIVLLGHIIVFCIPSFWQKLVVNTKVLYTIEILGLAFALFAFIGLIILLIRRLIDPKIFVVTSIMDLVILILLVVEVFLGVFTATKYPWGASWSTQTVVPYLWSVISFQPDISYVSQMPCVIKLHIIVAWLIILLVPFSRLVHIFSLPLEYLFRAPQLVIWNSKKSCICEKK